MRRTAAKSQFLLLLLVLLTGCASSGPPLPPSLEVPSPVTDLRVLRKGDKVYLAWTGPARTTDHQAIRHPGPTLICRSRENAMKECGTAADEVPAVAVTEKIRSKKQALPAKTTVTYTDRLPILPGVQPEDEINYAVEVLNDRKRGAGLSNQVRVPLLPAVPPPDGFQAEVTAQGVKITWPCPSPPLQLANVEYRLQVFRRLEGNQTDDKIAEPDFTGCQGPTVLDTSFEWEKKYEYRAAVITIVSVPGKPVLEIEGEDTPGVLVSTHDIFPPAVPSGLQAVFSGPGQQPFVDLIWSPDSDADLAGYNIYRHEEGGSAEKVNPELVKTPAYRDGKVQSGKTYFYSVSAVDMRDNESARSEETSEVVP